MTGSTSQVAAAAKARVPTRASMRGVLLAVLRTDADLDAFCLDFFPEVHGEFTAGMLRTAKLNLLLSRAATDDIWARLQASHPNESPQHEPSIVLGDGRDALPTSLLDVRERRNRQRMLEKVRTFWIEGVLEKSLHGEVLIELGKEYRPDEVAYPWELLLERPDTAPQPVAKGTRMIELFDENLGELLILGAPGSGKTTMLLDLCRDLLRRAELDETAPIPVVFTLSSWKRERGSLIQWMIDEMEQRYGIAQSVGTPWLQSGNVIPLLDGADEVDEKFRNDCLAAIEQFKIDSMSSGLVLCMRSADYRRMTKKIRLMTALELQSLTEAQIKKYLNDANLSSESIQEILSQPEQALALMQSPLFLTLALKNFASHDQSNLSTSSSEPAQRLFGSYARAMVIKRSQSPIQALTGLRTIARVLINKGSTIFTTEDLQPSTLEELLPRPWLAKLQLFTPLLLLALSLFVFLILTGSGLEWFSDIRTFKGAFISSPFLLLPLAILSGEDFIKLKRNDSFSWKRLFILILTSYVLICVGLFAERPISQSLSISLVTTIIITPFVASIGLPILYRNANQSNDENPDSGTAAMMRIILVILVMAFVVDPIALRLGSEILRTFGEQLSLSQSWGFAFILLTLLSYCGLLISFYSFGGLSLLAHYSLRLVMARQKVLPLRLQRFLDTCVDGNLLRRVGGGYLFIHRLLMEYFASLTDEDLRRLSAGATPQARDRAA